MTDKQDKLPEELNSPVSYWDGLKSIEFWQEFGQEGRLTSLSIWLFILFLDLFVLLWDVKLYSKINNSLLLLVVGIAIWIVDQFIVEQLKVFQFAKQLEIITAAQKLASQETGEEKK